MCCGPCPPLDRDLNTDDKDSLKEQLQKDVKEKYTLKEEKYWMNLTYFSQLASTRSLSTDRYERNHHHHDDVDESPS